MTAPAATIEDVPSVVPSPNQLPIFEELAAPPPRPRRPHLRLQQPLLADLTARQRRAVTHGEGPLLIVAGAGTGKTTVITRRIAWLIAEKRAAPSEILALTFTDRAAAEMTERVDQLVPYGYTDATIATFHAFGDRLLREHALEAGLSDRSTVLSRSEQIIFLREHLFELPLDRYRPLGDPTRFLSALVTLFSRARDEDLTPDDYRAAADALLAEAGHQPDDAALADAAARQAELAACYATYERLMRAGDRLDFGDQVSLALRLLRDQPAVLAAERARYRYILVDEFQDTNHAQFELVQLLAGSPRANVTVVGDDDQSIYRFRGAALGNILTFREAYPRAKSVVLVDNFRSRQEILDASHRLIVHNDPHRLEAREGIDKRLRARSAFRRAAPPTGAIELVGHATGSDEADAVAARIAAGLRAGRPAGDHAVLVRGNRDAEPFLRALNMARIPWRFSGTAGLYQQQEVRVLVSLPARRQRSGRLGQLLRPRHERDLRARGRGCDDRAESRHPAPHAPGARAPRGGRASRRVAVRTPRAGGGGAAAGDDRSASRARHGAHVGRAALPLHRRQRLAGPAGGGGARDRRCAAPERRALLRDRAPPVVTAAGRPASVPRRAARHAHRGRRRSGNRRRRTATTPTRSMCSPTTRRRAWSSASCSWSASSTSASRPARAAMRSSCPPACSAIRCRIADHHLAEERRLFYVGMTRAREELVLSWAADYGGRRSRRLSPFVIEALDLPPATPLEAVRPSVLERLARHEEPARVPATSVATPALADRPLALSLRPGERLPRLSGAISVRSRHSHPDPAEPPAGLRPRASCRGPGVPSSPDGGPADGPRRAARRARCRLGVGRIPDPRPRGGAPGCGAGRA